MAATANLSSILRHYAKKQNSAFFHFRDFLDYIQKYAARHIEENEELVKYIEVTDSTLMQELENLAEKHEIHIIRHVGNKVIIVVITYYSVQFANQFREILTKPNIPYPTPADLPKLLPADALDRRNAADLLPQLQESQDIKSPVLYCMAMPREIPSVLFPACVPVHFLIRSAMIKIRAMLKKEEYHDYFLKKLRISNPNKEISIRSFYSKFVQFPDSADQTFDLESESFYLWTQLCYFIKQDFEKVKDRTSEDTNILQSVAISEIWLLSLKEKAAKEQSKEQALKELELALEKAPFFYDMDAILKFKDSKGTLLYGQYSEEELKEFLKKLTTETEGTALPKILVFKIESGTRFFIYKSKVFPLVLRLANEAHDTLQTQIVDEWFKILSNYNKTDEMKDSKIFEEKLKERVKVISPVLYALLSANFLPILNFENNQADEHGNSVIFSGGKLLTYSDILMLRNSSLLASAKMLLPFWYTIPIVSWIASFLFKKKEPQKKQKSYKEFSSDDIPDDLDEAEKTKKNTAMSKKDIISSAAKQIAKDLIPPGSTIDRELDSYLKQWNHLITKEAYIQLNEDVNNLIRDYMRKVIKTISASTFTAERVKSLASDLCKTANMKRINGGDALFMYVQLYILRLVSNT